MNEAGLEKIYAPWEIELECHRKAGLNRLDFDLISEYKEILELEPSPLADTNLEEVLPGPGGTVLVMFVDEYFIDQWALKDDLSWSKPGTPVDSHQ